MCKSPSLRARPSIGLKMCWQPAGDGSALAFRIAGRIQALSNVRRLFESRWAGAEIHSLVTEELSAYAQDRAPTVKIEGPQLLLEPSAAQAIAVIVHELATNAAKYGALSVPKGRVQPAKQPTHRGFGTRVMDGMIRGQLRGEMHLNWRPQGLACEIVLST